MKKRMLCTAALALSMMLTACSGSAQSETTAAETTAASTAAETTAEETTATETDAPDEISIEGTIAGVDGSRVTITNDEGELSFDLSGAEMTNEFPLSAGDEVSVTYYEGATEDPIPAIDLEVYVSVIEESSDPMISGTITDAAMNTLTIEDEDGESYTFLTTNAYVVSKDGITVGAAAEVTYIGDFEEPDSVLATRIVTEDSYDTDEAFLYKFHGEVIGIDGSNIVVEAENGNMFTFTSDTLKFSSYSEGSSVEIEYTGTLTEKEIPAVNISTY